MITPRRFIQWTGFVLAGALFFTGCAKKPDGQESNLTGIDWSDESLECMATPSQPTLELAGNSVSASLHVVGGSGGRNVPVSIMNISHGEGAQFNPAALNRAATPHQVGFRFEKTGRYVFNVSVKDSRGLSAMCEASITVVDEDGGTIPKPEPIPEAPELRPRGFIMVNGLPSSQTHFNGSATLSWQARDVNHCKVFHVEKAKPVFIGNASATDPLARGVHGFVQLKDLKESATYQMICDELADESGRKINPIATLEVLPLPETDLRISAAGQIMRNDIVVLNFGMGASVHWASNESVERCHLFVETPEIGSALLAGNLPKQGSYTMPAPTSAATIRIACQDAGNNSAQDAVGIRFNAPTARIWVDADTVMNGGSTTVRWETTNAAACTGPIDNPQRFPEGHRSTGNLSADKTFSISCVGPGGTASDSVTVRVRETCNIHAASHTMCGANHFYRVVAFLPAVNYRIVPENTSSADANNKFNAANPDFSYSVCNTGINGVPQTARYANHDYQLKTNNNLGSAECPVAFTSTLYSPLIIDLLGHGIELTAPNEGVQFDLKADGEPAVYSWVANPENSLFLVHDQNTNGLIDDGNELFGNYTIGPDGKTSPNGFEALKKYDANGDGFIDSQDEIYGKLQLWSDLNKNGISEGNELFSLGEKGLARVDLKYLEVEERNDFYGNQTRQRSVVDLADGTMRAILDVWFVRAVY